jgi:hypothetical protein
LEANVPCGLKGNRVDRNEDMIRRAAAPMSAEEVAAFSANVRHAQRTGEGFVGFWLEARQACITATMLHGELQSWSIFPAETMEAARNIANGQRAIAEMAINLAANASAQVVASVIEKARGN